MSGKCALKESHKGINTHKHTHMHPHTPMQKNIVHEIVQVKTSRNTKTCELFLN